MMYLIPSIFKGEILCFTFQLLELQLCRYHQLPSFQPTFLVPFINQVAIITVKQLMTLCRIKQQKILLSKVSLIERQKLQAAGSKELNFPLINFLFPRCTILKWRRESRARPTMYERILMMQHGICQRRNIKVCRAGKQTTLLNTLIENHSKMSQLFK